MNKDECEKICDCIKKECWLSTGGVDFYAKKAIKIIRRYVGKDSEDTTGYIAEKKLQALKDKIIKFFMYFDTDSFLPFDTPPDPPSSSEDGDTPWGVNHATDRWGGAGPDCENRPEEVRLNDGILDKDKPHDKQK